MNPLCAEGLPGAASFLSTRDKKQLPEKAAVFSFVLGQGRAVALLRLGGFSGGSPAGYILFWPDGTIGSERDRREAR